MFVKYSERLGLEKSERVTRTLKLAIDKNGEDGSLLSASELVSDNDLGSFESNNNSVLQAHNRRKLKNAYRDLANSQIAEVLATIMTLSNFQQQQYPDNDASRVFQKSRQHDSNPSILITSHEINSEHEFR